MKQQIHIDGRNWNDLFRLDCVDSINKHYMTTDSHGNTTRVDRQFAYLRRDALATNETVSQDVNAHRFAFVGDDLIQHDNGKWEVRHQPKDPRIKKPVIE